jgi:DNA repair protein RadC
MSPHVSYARRSKSGTITIKEWPVHDRPRERLRAQGPRTLTARELLALLIETGTPASEGRPARSAMDLASDLLRWAAPGEGAESLRRIMTSPLPALCEVPGIGPAKAARILAALDLGRRAIEEARPDLERFTCARDVYERMRVRMRDLPQEEFHILLLNLNGELLRDVVIARGTLDRCAVHARDVFRHALAESAHSVVLVHNHPSGEPTPSPEDRQLTRRFVSAGNLLGVTVVDHVIIGEGRYASFCEEGLLDSGW